MSMSQGHYIAAVVLVAVAAGQGSQNCSTGTPVFRNWVTGPWTSPPANANGTNAFAAGCGTNVGRWYTYTGSTAYNGEIVTVTTCSGTTTADTYIGVYTSCSATCLTANDDDSTCAESLASTVSFTADYFLTYYIWVSFNGDGDYQLQLRSSAVTSPSRTPNNNYYYTGGYYGGYYDYASDYANYEKTQQQTTALAIALPVAFFGCFFVAVPLLIICCARRQRARLLAQARNKAPQQRGKIVETDADASPALPSATAAAGAGNGSVLGGLFGNNGGVDVYTKTSLSPRTGGDPSADVDRGLWVTKSVTEVPDEGPSRVFPSATDATPYVGYMDVKGTNHAIQLPLRFSDGKVDVRGGRGTYSERTHRFAFTITEDNTVTEFTGLARPGDGPPSILSELAGNWRRVGASNRVVSGPFVLIADMREVQRLTDDDDDGPPSYGSVANTSGSRRGTSSGSGGRTSLAARLQQQAQLTRKQGALQSTPVSNGQSSGNSSSSESGSNSGTTASSSNGMTSEAETNDGTEDGDDDDDDGDFASEAN